jgi:hypothetical protein
VYEVVQYAEIEVHTDLVEHRLESGVEGFAVLGHDQGGPDGAQTLGGSGALPGTKSCGCAVILGPPLALVELAELV